MVGNIPLGTLPINSTFILETLPSLISLPLQPKNRFSPLKTLLTPDRPVRDNVRASELAIRAEPSWCSLFCGRRTKMSERHVIANQNKILKNQKAIVGNQGQIKANQEVIKKNQSAILKNQKQILAAVKK
jgi:hypothetical protein